MPISSATIRPQLEAVLGGQLEIHEPIGSGAFAVVFRARDPFLERDVAVKVLDPSLGPSEELQAQFLREARIVAGVEHPHIVPLYTAESRGNLLYLVMRLLPGRTLADRIAAEGRLQPSEAARLAHEIAQALAAAHDHGVVHRDLKPGNVLLDSGGHAFVTDFGISRVTAHTEDETPGIVVGTPGYMSPEQIAGAPLDGRSDVYALGVLMFEMLTGTPPFEASDTREMLFKHVNVEPPRVESLQRDVPTALARLTANCLTKLREERPSAADVVSALTAARSPDAMLTPRAARWRRIKRPLAMVGAVLATVAVLLVGAQQLWNILAGLIVSGEPPRLEATGNSIPPAVLETLRSRGALKPGEMASYVFAPSAGDNGEMFVIGDSAITWSSTTELRRFRKTGLDLEVGRETDSAGTHGYLILTEFGGRPDTLTTRLSGLEVVRLLTMIALGSKERATKTP